YQKLSQHVRSFELLCSAPYSEVYRLRDLHSENPPAFKASHRRATPKTGFAPGLWTKSACNTVWWHSTAKDHRGTISKLLVSTRKLRNGIEIGHVHFRGSFGKYIRDEHLLTLEEAIRKMTSKVAARVLDHRKFGAFSHDSRQNSRNNHRGFAQEEQ